MFKTTFVMLASVLALSGCATLPGECDPSQRDVSMLAKMRCDGAGGYRQVVDDRESELLHERELNAMFHQTYEDIQAQRISERKSLDEQKKRQAALVTSTQKLLTQLKNKNQENAGAQRQLALAQKDLNALQALPVGAGEKEQQAKQAQLQALQQTVLRLQRSLGYAP